MSTKFKKNSRRRARARVDFGAEIERDRANGVLYEAWTDGSCDNIRTKAGGSGYIVLKDGEVIKSRSKGFLNTTNNRMELLAIISAVNSVPVGHSVLIHTDSQYCILALDGRDHKANADLINLFHKVSKPLKQVYFEWVKGHAGNRYNEIADDLAFSAYKDICEKHNLEVHERMQHTR